MRTQYGRLLAFLSSELGDGDDAEDALQEALLAALTSWPDDGVPAQELPGRLEAVLEAIYAAYGLGRDEAVGADARRGDLVDEAIWLARVVRERMPDEAEVRGLLALLLFCDARRQAGRSPGRRSRCATIISSDFSDLGRPRRAGRGRGPSIRARGRAWPCSTRSILRPSLPASPLGRPRTPAALAGSGLRGCGSVRSRDRPHRDAAVRHFLIEQRRRARTLSKWRLLERHEGEWMVTP